MSRPDHLLAFPCLFSSHSLATSFVFPYYSLSVYYFLCYFLRISSTLISHVAPILSSLLLTRFSCYFHCIFHASLFRISLLFSLYFLAIFFSIPCFPLRASLILFLHILATFFRSPNYFLRISLLFSILCYTLSVITCHSFLTSLQHSSCSSTFLHFIASLFSFLFCPLRILLSPSGLRQCLPVKLINNNISITSPFTVFLYPKIYYMYS